MMHQIILNGRFFRTWQGPCPGVEEEWKKAKASEDGFSYAFVADGEYPEGEEVSHFDLKTGKRVVDLPKVEPSETDLLWQELSDLLRRCNELDAAAIRAIRAAICKTDTASDKPLLIGIETDMKAKRERIRELRQLLNIS